MISMLKFKIQIYKYCEKSGLWYILAIYAEEMVILVLIFHIFIFLSGAFATMAKSYTSQTYMNGNRDCNTFKPWSNMQIILFLYS